MANNSIKDLLEEARIRAEISKNLQGYLEGVGELKTLQKTINDNLKHYATLEKQQTEARARGEQDIVNKIEEQLKYIREQNKAYDIQIGMLKVAVKEANKYQMALIATGKAGINGLAKLPGLVQQNWGKLKGFGLFEMEKAVKMSALQMGLLGKEGKSYSESIRKTAADTNEIGVGIEALAKMQGQYAEDLGRTVMLGDKGLKSMAAMSVATGLGAEGAGELAANMDEVGISAERTGQYIEQTMNDSHKMGLNASKVVKNISGNIKMLNKYHFKDGIRGLAKMAELSAKLGVKMDFAAGMSDKMWDIEGAVDMSAQLQVMGGAWAKMADPFHLMYMAREDMAGLTKEIATASQESMHFAKDGSIEMSSMAMSKLKIIAQQTGLEYDDLVKSGKEMFKMNKVKTQIGVGIAPEMQEFIANTAQLTDGKATIEILGNTKLVSQLTGADQTWLKGQMAEKKSMVDRAKAAQNFDDQVTNLINQFKTYMLPIVDGINETMKPIVEKFFKDPKWKDDLISLGKSIGGFITKLGPVLSTIGSMVLALGPTGTLAVLLGGKLLLDAGKWILNGVALGTGFLSTTKGFMGTSGMPGSSSAWKPGQTGPGPTPNAAFGMSTQSGVGANFKAGLGSKMLKLGGVATGLLSAYNEYSTNKDKGMSTGENAARTGIKGVGAGGGAWAGAASGAAIGTLAGPIGTLVGGAIGGALGAWGGGAAADATSNAIYGPKANDAKFSGNGRGFLQGGKITPLNNEDDIFALKPRGAAAKASKSTPSNIEVTHSPLEINGTLMINTPGNPGQGVDLLKDAHFIRQITSMIHSETKRTINGAQVG